MIIDEERLKTPFWITKDKERKKTYTDHNMMEAVIDWRLKLVDEKPPRYMGKKELAAMGRQLDEERISEIINEADLKGSYDTWSNKVRETAEKNKMTRKKKNEWKGCRLLNKAKKHINNCIKKKKDAQKDKILKQRKEYIEEYIHMELQEKMRIKVERITDGIKKDGGVDGETFWKVRKRILGRKKEARYAIKDKNGVLRENPDDIKLVYQEFYDDLLNGRFKEPPDKQQVEHIKDMIHGLEILNKLSPDPETTEEKCEKVIQSLKLHKAGDKTGWKNEFLKWGSQEMETSLHKIFETATRDQEIPEEWELVLIKSIMKKKPHNEMKNKRGLFLTSIVGKEYEGVIKERNEE